MAVSKRLRFEILRRDNHACRYCGATAPDVALTVDHVVPTALGGTDEPTNLVTACAPCNSGKSSVPADATIVADVAADALRWAAAMRYAADLAAAERDRLIEIEKAFWEFWDDAKYYNRSYSEWLPDDWYGSVHRWLKAGLTKEDLLEGSHITIYRRNKKPTYDEAWKYFCGVMWRMLTERQQVAWEIVSGDEAGA